MDKFKAVGFDLTDKVVSRNGKVEIYLCSCREHAMDSWLYTHKLHNGLAFVSSHGACYCPKCGYYTIVRDK